MAERQLKVVDAPEIDPPATTADAMMRLQRMIREATGQPFYKTAAIREVDSENEYGPFKVLARLPGGNELVTALKPTVTDERLQEVLAELLEMQEFVKAAAQKPIVDESGQQIAVETVRVNGRLRPDPPESEATQNARTKKMLEESETVNFDASVPGYPHGLDIAINGFAYKVFDGMNSLPRPIYDQYVKWRGDNSKRAKNAGGIINRTDLYTGANSPNSDHPAFIRTTLNLEEA